MEEAKAQGKRQVDQDPCLLQPFARACQQECGHGSPQVIPLRFLDIVSRLPACASCVPFRERLHQPIRVSFWRCGPPCPSVRAPATADPPPVGASAADCSLQHASDGQKVESLTFDSSVPFLSFLASLPRHTLACKTKFSHFLGATLHLQRSGEPASSSALFPLPVPFPGIFEGSGPKLAAKRCKSLMLKRGVHVIAMCLNYVYCGGKWTPFAELRRPPPPFHVAAYERIRRFLCACGSLAPQIPLCPGRRSHELVAIIRSVAAFPAQGGYGQVSFGAPPAPDADRPELHPYSNLNAERLKISGLGKFWPVPFLQPNLILPFLEPKVLRFTDDPFRCTDSAAELDALFRKWDERGLLAFVSTEHEEWEKVRVFNARKNTR